MSVTADMQRHVKMLETNGNPPSRAWVLCPDGGVEDRVPAMECEADIMQVSATRTPLDTNSLGSTGLSKVLIVPLTGPDSSLSLHASCKSALHHKVTYGISGANLVTRHVKFWCGGGRDGTWRTESDDGASGPDVQDVEEDMTGVLPDLASSSSELSRPPCIT